MLKPMGDKILVKPEERIKSSIIAVIQDEQFNMGTVIAVGNGKKLSSTKREEMPVAVGDRIRFGTMNREKKEEYLKFTEHFEGNQRYLLMSWKDVCFIVD